MRNPHVPPGFWRGVNLNQNAIYLECFIDELAHAAGQDPLAFRRKLMAKPPEAPGRARTRWPSAAGWGKPAPAGVHPRPGADHGLRQLRRRPAPRSRSAPTGKLKVHRIVAATDPGHAVNPQQIEAQVEGSFVYGLSAALYGEMHGQGRPHRADELRHLPGAAHRRDAEGRDRSSMPSGGFWGGVGEPTIAVAAPAVLNAIFAATGKRIRTLPLKNHSLKQA